MTDLSLDMVTDARSGELGVGVVLGVLLLALLLSGGVMLGVVSVISGR